MKNILFFLIIIVICISCSNNDECLNKNSSEVNNVNTCEGQNLGITELNKFSLAFYIPNTQTVDYSISPRWTWNERNGVIEIEGFFWAIGREFERHFFFKRKGSCIEYLFTRDVEFDDGGVTIDPVTNQVINSGYRWDNYRDLKFTLQSYQADKFLLGDVSGTKFWADFTPDVHKTTPYDYEQYYHD